MPDREPHHAGVYLNFPDRDEGRAPAAFAQEFDKRAKEGTEEVWG